MRRHAGTCAGSSGADQERAVVQPAFWSAVRGSSKLFQTKLPHVDRLLSLNEFVFQAAVPSPPVTMSS